MRTRGALLAVLVVSSVSCRYLHRSAAKSPEDAKIERGQTMYFGTCAACHATGRAPDLYRSPLVARDKNGDVIGPFIRVGRPEVGMPAFTALTATQIGDLSAFLDRQAKDIRAAGPKTTQLSTGNAAAGKTYFEAKCSACHSATGDFAGVASRLSPIDLQNRMFYPGAGVVRTATVTERDGGQFTGVVDYDDEFNVAITGTDGRYHSWLRDEVTVDIHDPLERHRALLAEYTNSDVHNVFAYLSTLK